MLAAKRIKEPKAAAATGNWWEKKAEPVASVEPVFALARLSPSAGAARLFERPGPNEKLNAVIAGAESLPWDEAGRQAWNDGLTRWLIGTN